MADLTGRRGLRDAARQVGGAVEEAVGQMDRRDALFKLFVEELQSVMQANGEKLLGEREALRAYDDLRAGLSPTERDAFLRTLLRCVQNVADDDRGALREMIRRHIDRLTRARREEP